MAAKPKYDVFLSHSSSDKIWARKLAAELKKEGLNVWLDDNQKARGTDIFKKKSGAIKNSSAVVTVVDAKAKPNVFIEAGMAIAHGKSVTFVVPKGTVALKKLPKYLGASKVVYRTGPIATGRLLMKKRKKEVEI